ncbi:MAG: hypothetical protein ACK4YP_08605, partial [Myxococcota bacterium]
MSGSGWVAATTTVLMGSGCLAGGREESSERVRDDGPISRIDVELDAGNVEIVGAPDFLGVNGTVTSRWMNDDAPEVVHYVQDGVLHVLGRCATPDAPCILDVSLTVPMDANVSIDTGMGDVITRAITGDVEISVADGNIEGHQIGGTFFVETEQGDILGDGLTGTLIDARTGAGDVEMQITGSPIRVVGRSGNGDIVLNVPPGSYRIDADTPQGDLEVSSQVVDDPGAASAIIAETDNGDVRIDGRAPRRPGTGTPDDGGAGAPANGGAPGEAGGRDRTGLG